VPHHAHRQFRLAPQQRRVGSPALCFTQRQQGVIDGAPQISQGIRRAPAESEPDQPIGLQRMRGSNKRSLVRVYPWKMI
jgi:hypothetical protein